MTFRARSGSELVRAGVGVIALVFAMWLGSSGAALRASAGPMRIGHNATSMASDAQLRSIDDVAPVASYRLDARLDTELHVVEGQGTIRFRNVSSAPLDHLWIHLYLNAFEHDQTVFRRSRATGMRGHDVVAEAGQIEVSRFHWREADREIWPASARGPADGEDRTDLRVPLPRPLAPGEIAHFEIGFRSKLPSVVLRTGFFGSFHMVAQWFPKIAKLEPDGKFAHFDFERYSEFYADFGDYDVTIDVPEAYVVGATGVLDRETVEGGRRVVRYLQRAVHDFAFSAWDQFLVLEQQHGDVSLRCLFPADSRRAAEKELEAATRGLDFYGAEYGPYPYSVLTIVHPPDGAAEAGGMEYPTLITTGGSAWSALLPARLLEGLTLHELGHQWFYGLVATNENAYPFLDEGVTSFATGQALSALYGEDGMVDHLPLPVHLAAIERAAQLGTYGRAPVVTRAGGFDTGSDYARIVYARPATILRTLDGAFGGAGSRAVSRYAREQRFAHPGPDALVEAVRAEGGEVAAAFAHAALFDKGWVDFEVVSAWSTRQDDGVHRGEIVIARRGDLILPVDVEWTDVRGERGRVSWAGDSDFVRLPYAGEAALRAVQADPDQLVLVDESRLNDALSVEPSHDAPRTLLLSAFASALLFHTVSP